MIEYEIGRCTRRCYITGRELRDGELCYSALIPDGGGVTRRDYAIEAWEGPPEGAIGWWKTVVADPAAGRATWAPHDVMLNYFESLLDDPGSEDTRYVMALLLVQRRILRVEGEEKDAAGRSVLRLHCSRNQNEYRVAEVMPTRERTATIQQQLADLLKTPGR